MKITLWLAGLLLGSNPMDKPVDPEKPGVVLVHGIFDSGRNMEWLARELASEGYETFCPTLAPSNGAKSLPDLSQQLDEQIKARFPANRRLHLVAFSMGGLISRYWLQNQADRTRIVSFVTLGTPHHGSLWAWLVPLPGTRDMRRGSPFLHKLQVQDADLRAMPLLSIHTPLDLMIVPANSSVWPIAKNELVWLPAHPLLIYNRKVARRLLSWLDSQE